MLKVSSKTWIKILLLNLTIVATLGALMRFKIGFEFPYFDQKYLQFAHSHFAFAGWVTQALLVLITGLLQPYLETRLLKKYNLVLWLNLICAYGMLFSFIVQGYGHISITFSTISILLIFIFTILFYNHSKKLQQYPQAIKWFFAALVFAMLSTAGTASLTYMMVTHHIHQNAYLASIYFYLHFQYNGWFFFACIALFISQANKQGIRIKDDRLIFALLAGSCIPAYFLSTLWAHLPLWLYIIVVIATITQLAGWIFLLKNTFQILLTKLNATKLSKFLVYFVAIAGSVKYLLQLGSTIPFLSTLAFGFRPIVIAYLHLVLLGIISISLILYMYSTKLLAGTRFGKGTILFFSLAVLINELVLAVQGIASFGYVIVPYTNLILFIIAILLVLAALWMYLAQYVRQAN